MASRIAAEGASFGPGSLIEVEAGFVPVDWISEGDLVETRDHGLQPVRSVAHHTLWMGHVARHPHHRPVKIDAGALGDGRPWRRLVLSPWHRVRVEGPLAGDLFGEEWLLTAAARLTRLDGIEQEAATKITYRRLTFDQPVEIRGEGLWCQADALKEDLRLTG
ncbi:MAG: Hint domain-containing protein [Pseudomonadota bacterium]